MLDDGAGHDRVAVASGRTPQPPGALRQVGDEDVGRPVELIQAEDGQVADRALGEPARPANPNSSASWPVIRCTACSTDRSPRSRTCLVSTSVVSPMAWAVRCLLAEEASYITGSVVTVDGGLSMGA